MTSFPVRLGRIILWMLVTVMVLLAIAVTTLRVSLPRLDRFQGEIETWVTEASGVPFKVGKVKGFWRNTHPSLSLKNLEAELGDESQSTFSILEVDIQLDLVASLIALEPKVASLNVKGLNLDISGVPLLGNSRSSETPSSQQHYQLDPIVRQLDQLFLRQLQSFALSDSYIAYRSFSGELRMIEIEDLKWLNHEQNHKLEGVVGLVGSEINSLGVRGDFDDNGTLLDITGDFYVKARNIKVKPWLTKYLQKETGIESGQISFNGWVSLENSQPTDVYAELLPSELVWNEKSEHVLMLEKGTFRLLPSQDKKGFQVGGHSLLVRTDAKEWPELDMAFLWEPDQWQLNLSQLDIQALLPLVHILPDSEKITPWITRLNPSGLIDDIRVAKGTEADSLHYSASLNNGSIQQWDLLPGVHSLSADIAGSPGQAIAHVQARDDVVPYGDVFQAPLNISRASTDIIWQADDGGWRLWSDRVEAETPDMKVLGAFRLDMPEEAEPFLSLYAETDLYHAGETWRYLPKRALGQNLTDFLSTAIQGGRVDTAQILWYGGLKHFPYTDNRGIFQAKVGLKDARFAFDTAWPPITDLQLDLLFENESMYLDSHSAKLMDVTAKRIVGQIPRLHSDSQLEIKAVATGQGEAVREYMTSSPLVDSVGAALTAVQVSGDVYSEFQLNIPLSRGRHTRAWGYADLAGNHIEIDSPPMELEKARGRITFDNDVVGTSGLSAVLLDQPVSLDFSGEQQKLGYMVDIDVVGDWDAKPLIPHVGKKWLGPVKGHAPWSMGVDLQLNDVGFTYQIDTRVNLEFVASQYPQPLTKALGQKGEARLQASGNQESISGRIQLPGVKYQAEIDITGERPVLTATNLLVGQGGFKVSPVVGNDLTIRTESFNMDDWISFSSSVEKVQDGARLSQMNTPEIPNPDRITISADTLKLATLDWHDVQVKARKKSPQWQIKASSAELNGQARYLEPYDLSVSLENLHLNLPALNEDNDDPETVPYEADASEALISEFDRRFHKLMPNLTLNIQDFWVQGYKVGKANVELLRKDDRLEWQNIEFSSGQSRVKGNGWWKLDGDQSISQFSLNVSGEDNSELMERFGISSGIQKAPFNISSEMSWEGAPWSMRVNTLSGNINSELGKGVISDVSGAARLLGLFSLDSIIRKMQLDFSDVFDDGMAFNSITGSGKVKEGIFVTNDIKMDAVAGDMTIRGMADLNQRLVDAEVEFIPDLTSGLPVLTAFAITPQTAVLVYAVSKVISPVVDVFTQIRYQVKGPLSNPEVTELSRSRGEYKLPEEQRQKIKGLK
ncbi:TIGR02099 family protein [Vibrio albus]|uniref:TIGR02099 family protein n=1 Tax=Vibrio albus TaxID=2200953 RepID=A0A2U3B5K6_9VIBR|nr:YhdP family protein [Vibrio albus]PWI32004.1 TIGR02099 family protein [Vibrio albus]